VLPTFADARRPAPFRHAADRPRATWSAQRADRERVDAASNRVVSAAAQRLDRPDQALASVAESPNARIGDVWRGSFSTRNAVVFGSGSRSRRGHVSGESGSFSPSKFQSSPSASTRSASPYRARRANDRWPSRAVTPAMSCQSYRARLGKRAREQTSCRATCWLYV
jgi:hypothetical protein